MKQYLFLFSIGPVQSFVAQARKMQDLYGASQLLSDLSKAAANCTVEQGIELIFPKKVDGTVKSLPNRFIGRVRNKSANDLQAIGEKVEASVRKKFRETAQNALDQAKSGTPDNFWKQIEQHLDINWLFHHIKGESNDDYKEAYKEIEMLMAAIKNVRVFEQLKETGRKCSLDGERNALFFAEGNPIKQGVKVSSNSSVWLNDTEGLSAVSLVKRTYDKTNFPSTAKITLMDYIEKNINSDGKLKNKYEEYRLCLGGNKNFDEQLCYEENVTEKYLEKNGYKKFIDRSSFQKIKKLHTEVFGSNKLPKYYALVAFDGDKMGKILSGAQFADEITDLAEFQGKISGFLSEFAAHTHSILKEPKGEVVYAGGDDFLGFVNLEHLFEVVKDLRYGLDEKVNKRLFDKNGKHYLKEAFTFSAGIVIAHYKSPLSIALQTVRAMEKKAKDDGDRDAFAIAVLKHSGESNEAYFKWNVENGLTQWNALKDLVNHLQNDCSDTFIRSLEREFMYLKDAEGKVKYPEIIDAEIRRLIKNSLNENKKNELNKIYETVKNLLTIQSKRIGDIAHLENFTEAMKVALFIKRVNQTNHARVEAETA